MVISKAVETLRRALAFIAGYFLITWLGIGLNSGLMFDALNNILLAAFSALMFAFFTCGKVVGGKREIERPQVSFLLGLFTGVCSAVISVLVRSRAHLQEAWLFFSALFLPALIGLSWAVYLKIRAFSSKGPAAL